MSTSNNVTGTRRRPSQRPLQRARGVGRPADRDERQAADIFTWPHSGFHVHTVMWVPEREHAVATRLVACIT